MSQPTRASPPAVVAVVQAPEQLRYARWLGWGTSIGLMLLVATFAAYLLGWLPPRIPVHELPGLWHHPVNDYLRLAEAPHGWAWLAGVAHGDLAGLLGIAFLAGCSVPCLLALVPLYARAGDRAYVAICLAEVAVLLLAASGVLTAGH